MKTRTILKYILVAIIVIILGGLAGWYFFLRTQTQATDAQSLARGYGDAVPQGSAFGDGSSSSQNTNDADQAPPQVAQPGQRPPQLWRVHDKPTAGQIFIGSGGSVRLRYVERASGNIFEANPETGQVVRITNTLLPKIYEALLTENGHVYERSIDTEDSVSTFVGTVASTTNLSASSSRQSLLGSYLPKDILNISVDAKTGAIFYLVKNSSGVAGIQAGWDGGNKKTIFESTLTSWQPTILEDGRIILVQAAADSVPGYAYELKNGTAPSLLLGPVPGLTLRARPASGQAASSAILWGQSVRGVMNLFVRVNREATETLLPIRTIADKCAWSPLKELVAYCGVPQGATGQNFLDDWYRGATHSSDTISRIDASAGTAETIYTPALNTPIDIENMSVDRGGNYITFMNAADKSLWLLRLTK